MLDEWENSVLSCAWPSTASHHIDDPWRKYLARSQARDGKARLERARQSRQECTAIEHKIKYKRAQLCEESCGVA